MFYTQPAGSTNSWTTAQAVGQSVYNRAGERIGEVDELLIDNTGKVSAVIIGVGGFLGLGERKVAVNFSSLEMTREGNGNPRMVVDLDKTTLREAPEYRVTGNRS
jgi:sporulation protein YlmC with PRC-barrel domain